MLFNDIKIDVINFEKFIRSRQAKKHKSGGAAKLTGPYSGTPKSHVTYFIWLVIGMWVGPVLN